MRKIKNVIESTAQPAKKEPNPKHHTSGMFIESIPIPKSNKSKYRKCNLVDKYFHLEKI